MREVLPAVYILASAPNGTLYIGVTSNLVQRGWQHRNAVADGFTRRYGVHLLVWYEQHGDMEHAILREKRLKHWNRAWKLRLVNEFNPEWLDLWPTLLAGDLRANEQRSAPASAATAPSQPHSPE